MSGSYDAAEYRLCNGVRDARSRRYASPKRAISLGTDEGLALLLYACSPHNLLLGGHPMHTIIRNTLAALAAAAMPAVAAAAPPIAVVKIAGSANEVWLINPDGTGAVRTYRGAPKVSISDLDTKPGGGELAFVENHQPIRVVRYNSAGNMLSSQIVPQPAGCPAA